MPKSTSPLDLDPNSFKHKWVPAVMEAYLRGQYRVAMTMCMQELTPDPNDKAIRPECPVCFPQKVVARPEKVKDPNLAITVLQTPVMVDCMELKPEIAHRIDNIIDWGRANDCDMEWLGANRGLYMPTRIGDLYGRANDWIIRNQEGVFLPIRPDAFWASHQLME